MVRALSPQAGRSSTGTRMAHSSALVRCALSGVPLPAMVSPPAARQSATAGARLGRYLPRGPGPGAGNSGVVT